MKKDKKKKVANSAELRAALATELMDEMRSCTSKISILLSAMLARMAADDKYFNEARKKPPKQRARKLPKGIAKVRAAGA